LAKYKTLEDYSFGELNSVKSENTKIQQADFERMSFFSILGNTIVKSNSINSLSDIGLFKGVVISDPVVEGTWIDRFLNKNDAENLIKVKVRIPELHAALPIPNGVNDKTIINMYPTFIGKRDGKDIPKFGALVYVDFGNRETMEEPLYIGLIEQAPDGFFISDSKDGDSSNGSKGAHGQNKTSTLKDSSVDDKSNRNEKDPPMKTVKITGTEGITIKVREDIVEDLANVVKIVKNLGAIIRFTQGVRELNSNADGNGDPKSKHYLGLAVDMNATGLYFHDKPTSINSLVNKSWIVEFLSKNRFLVWATTNYEVGTEYQGFVVEEKILKGMHNLNTYDIGPPNFNDVITRRVKVINISNIFKNNSFVPINAQSRWATKSIGLGSEWWHFEHVKSHNVSFEDGLRLIWKKEELASSRFPSIKNAANEKATI
jgi:hypothetical protein